MSLKNLKESLRNETFEAMAEAIEISENPEIQGYTDMKELKAALESDDCIIMK